MIIDRAFSSDRFKRDLVPLLNNPEIFQEIGIRVIRIEFPQIDVALWWRKMQREVILRVEALEYDYLPVSGWWIDANGVPLLKDKQQVPHGMGFQCEDGHPHVFQKAWFCFQGWREYHDHSGHQNIPWSSIMLEPEYRISGLIQQLNTDLNRSEVNVI